MNRKIRLLYQSDYSMAKTGFGRVSKALLEFLYKTGKYDITHYCCGMPKTHPDFSRTPWRSIGCLPDNPKELEEINRDPNLSREANYGGYLLDSVIQEVKPDIYLAAQDIWGVDFAIGRKWFNNIHSHIWTTLDSLPILDSAVEAAKKAKNYWVWSNFATEALHKMGHRHVKTVHGPISTDKFFKLLDAHKLELRKRHKINPDTFIVGFVFRNQLRKSVPNLLEGFKDFQSSNPNSKLLLHTHFGEGWRILKLADEYKVKHEDILTTYICRSCAKYHVSNFTGLEKECPHCKSAKSCTTTQPGIGVSEEELNEIYNLMDVYCHPFTSGGQEIPIQEAKLAELITLVTDYSCGQEMCEDGAASIPLDYSEYREHGTEFIKASTNPSSISKALSKVFKMDKQERKAWGKKGREWAYNNFSINVIGQKLDEYFSSLPLIEYDFNIQEEKRDPNAQIPEIKDDNEWLTFMYHNILKMRQVDSTDEGHKYWIGELAKGVPRRTIEDYFRKVASKENSKIEPVSIEKFLDKEGKENRILFVIPESIGDAFICTSLFKNLKETYPNKNLYVATKPENFEVFDANQHIHKVIPYFPIMDNLLYLEGQGNHTGFFEIAFLPYAGTQRFLDYLHNGKDKIQLSLTS